VFSVRPNDRAKQSGSSRGEVVAGPRTIVLERREDNGLYQRGSVLRREDLRLASEPSDGCPTRAALHQGDRADKDSEWRPTSSIAGHPSHAS